MTTQAANQAAAVPISITICGDGGCGKSSITLRLVRSQWNEEYDPTIEDSYSVTRSIDGATYHLSLTDTAGQEEYRGMWASSNLSADAFLLVYDITSSRSLTSLQYFNDLIDMEAEVRLDNAARAQRAGINPAAESNRNINDFNPVVASSSYAAAGSRTVQPVKFVVGNKCDLQDRRTVPAAQGLDWARRHGCGFMETSARLEVNIEETFALIVRRVEEARRMLEAGQMDDMDKNMRGMTAPLSPLPDDDAAKRESGAGDPDAESQKRRRGAGPWWKSWWCW